MYEVVVLVGGAVLLLAYKLRGSTTDGTAVHRTSPRSTPPPAPPVPQQTASGHDFAPPSPQMPLPPAPPPPAPGPPRAPAAAMRKIMQEAPPTPHAPVLNRPAPSPKPPPPRVDPTEAFDHSGGYAVIQVNEGHRDAHAVARALVEAVGFLPIDAGQYTNIHKGRVVAMRLQEPRASALQARLRADGLETMVAPVRDLEEIPFLGKAELLKYGEQALHVTRDIDQHHRGVLDVPWSDIQLICVGRVAISHSETHMDDFGEEPDEHPLRLQRHTSEEHLTACIFTAAGYIHIDVRDLGYAHLGPRLKPTSIHNFRTVVEDITSRAPAAKSSEGAAALLAGNFPAIPSFRNPAAWQEEACGTYLVLVNPDLTSTNG